MRIERIRSKNFIGLGDVDWIFPTGPIVLFFKDKSSQKMFQDLLLNLFYDQQECLPLIDQSQNELVEVWMSREDLRIYMRYEFIQKGHESERMLTLTNKNGQTVSLPEMTTLGEYLFNVQFQDFLLGGIVEWPKTDHYDYLFQRSRNLLQGGEEGLSITKVRASITGAQKRLREQKEGMALIKANYDALRREWETVHRQQEKERLLYIDLKNLQEKESILIDRITRTHNIQKRLDLLDQNPDYRELRRFQDELNQLEEQCRSLEGNLAANSFELSVDWEVIESLREECLEWARLQKNLSSINARVQVRERTIAETQNFLQTSGYQGLGEDEVLLLKRTVQEKDGAEEKLNRLILTKRRLNKLQGLFLQESTRLENFALMGDVQERDQRKIAQKEKCVEWWRNSKVGNTLDRTLRQRLGVRSIAEMLSYRLLQYYKRYHVSNYQEFTSQLMGFFDQQKRVERVKRQIERLQKKVSQEEKLRRIVHSRNEILRHAFTKVQSESFSEWLMGWEGYRRKKDQLSMELSEMHLELEQQLTEEKKLGQCAEQLHKNLEKYGIPPTDREEALGAVLKIANRLKEREELEREIGLLSEKFYGLLGDRNMAQLRETLEPLAELEREKCLPNEERLAEISAGQKELTVIRQHLAVTKQSIESNPKGPLLSVLEKKIEPIKSQWKAYEDLHHALEDAQGLLDLSWSEWQTKHEKTLSQEKQWIYDHCFSSSMTRSIEKGSVAKREYFSFRMAIAQLALGYNTETPLFFSIGKLKNEDPDQIFWEESTDYLRKQSLSRQVMFCTTDYGLGKKLSGRGWFLLV